MGMSCGTCGRDRKGVYRVLVWRPEGKKPLQDVGVDGSIILEWIFRKCDGAMYWIELAQDRDRWRAVVNTAMYLWIPYNSGNFLTS